MKVNESKMKVNESKMIGNESNVKVNQSVNVLESTKNSDITRSIGVL